MTVESVRAFFAEKAPDIELMELDASTATVALAAEALGVSEGQIAKTLSLRIGEEVIVLVTCGDARLDNRKYKQQFVSAASRSSAPLDAAGA